MNKLSRFSTVPSLTLLTLRADAERFTKKRVCPCCSNGYALTRVPRVFWLKYLLFFVPSRAYRCYLCAHTFVKLW